MYNRNSDHALNKRDADAIVYQDAGGNTIRLTLEDFSSEEEFLIWKAWSDADYHRTEKRNHHYSDHTVSFEDLFDRRIFYTDNGTGTDFIRTYLEI